MPILIVTFNDFLKIYNHQNHKTRHFYHPEISLLTLCRQYPPPHRPPGNYWFACSHCSFSFLELYVNAIIPYVLFCLLRNFPQHNSFEIHPYFINRENTFLYRLNSTLGKWEKLSRRPRGSQDLSMPQYQFSL